MGNNIDRHIDMTPTHKTAANIYMTVLLNKKAEAGAIKIAKEEIIKLGELADERNEFAKKLKKIEEIVDINWGG